MVAGAGCKLALSIATNTTVLCMLLLGSVHIGEVQASVWDKACLLYTSQINKMNNLK